MAPPHRDAQHHPDRHQRRAGRGGRHRRGIEDTTITGSVAANDSDLDDGATLSYALDAPVAGLTLNGDGSYSFDAADAAYQHLAAAPRRTSSPTTPSPTRMAPPSTASLTITLTGTNDAPVAVADTARFEDSTVTGSVAANDSDLDDGATLSYALDARSPG